MKQAKIIILYKSILEIEPMFFIDAICGGRLKVAVNRNRVAMGYNVMTGRNVLCRYKKCPYNRVV